MLKINSKIALILLTVAGILAYWPVFNAGYLLYDDTAYITENPYLPDFSFSGFIHLFTEKVYDLYIPFVWLSYWVEKNVLHFSAHGMHATNLLFHIANACLVYVLFNKLFKKQNISFLVASVFLLHPQHVESVAWLAERKDVLYAFFFLLALIRYVDFKTTASKKAYLLSVLFFVFSCLAKPMAVSLPLVLVFTDHFIYHEENVKTHLNKIPFSVVSLAVSIVAVLFMDTSSGQAEIPHYTVFQKIMLPVYELGFYAVKIFLPFNLSLIYPVPSTAEIIVYSLLFISLCTLVFWKGNKLLKYSIFVFIIIMGPALQLIPNANAPVADRYSYIGTLIPTAALFFWLDKKKFFSANFKVITILLSCILLIATYSRSSVFKNDEVLFTDVVKKNRASHTAFANRGLYYLNHNQLQPALKDLSEAARLKPKSSVILTNYAWGLAIAGEQEKALSILLRSADSYPFYFKTWNNMGVVLGMQSKYRLSLSALLLAYRLAPKNAEVCYNLSLTYGNLGMQNLAAYYYSLSEKNGLSALNAASSSL